MEKYLGKRRKIIECISNADRMVIGKLAMEDADILRAEYIEQFTDHDTAAAGDYLKIIIAEALVWLADQVEAVNFATTSEDIMSIVFGLIANELVYGHFMSALSDFMLDILHYAEFHEKNEALILPALTHQQPAEPTTLTRKFLTAAGAVRFATLEMRDFIVRDFTWKFKPFSGKFGGGVGNLLCHYAAYPDIDWTVFAKKFVEGRGLHYEELTNQSVTYVVEAQRFYTVANILTHIIKFTKDFVNLCSAPSHFFVKMKKEGVKGSSIFPNKYNAWGMEGAVKMLIQARTNLTMLAEQLPDYPHEGDMGRSCLFRDIGTAFMPIFIAFKRIRRELYDYTPNRPRIKEFFDQYPGMAGSSLQTVMKVHNVGGDAYRIIQNIAINPNGTYANSEEFKNRLEEKMATLNITDEVKKELRQLVDFKKLAMKAKDIADANLPPLKGYFEMLRKEAARYVKNEEAKNKL